MKINDLVKLTGMKKSFIRKCLWEMRDAFEPHINRGENNSLIFDSNVVSLFDQIKQQKEKRLSLKEIKKRLYESLDIPDKPGENDVEQPVKTQTNQPEKPRETSTQREDKLLELASRLHQAEIDKMKAQHELNLITSHQKLLPAGGDPIKLLNVSILLSKLEDRTRSRFGKGSEVKQLWVDLKQTLQSDSEKQDQHY